MKEKLIKIIPVLIFVFIIGSAVGLKAQTEDVADRLVRFHIVANSNSEADQAVKWEIRKKIFDSVRLDGISTKQNALDCFKAQKEDIISIANSVLKENNMPYKCSVYIGKKKFPVRKYDSFVLPAGIYDTVSVTLGEGNGENFFCVMYPSLCMINSVTEETNDSPQMLGGVLSDSEISAVTDTGNKTVIKFKIAEIIENIMSK